MPKHRADDFKRRLEEYVGGDQFQHYMDHLGDYPEKAKYILPALLMGIGAQLQLQWIHALVAQMDGDPITKADVQDFQDEVKRSLAMLKAAGAAWKTHCNQEQSNHGLLNTPRAGDREDAHPRKHGQGRSHLRRPSMRESRGDRHLNPGGSDGHG